MYETIADPPTPQIWSFMKYGDDFSVDHYTGTIRASIPIYVYKDKDFEIPVSLDYASGGFRPNKPAGPAGLNWFINAGGYIVRQIQGMADEKMYGYDIFSGFSGCYKKEPFYLIDDSVNYKTIFSTDRGVSVVNKYSRGCSYAFKNPRGSSLNIETSADIYTFRFVGHSGKFTCNFREPLVYGTKLPYGEYKVDIDNIIPGNGGQDGSVIRITTGDGYLYTFERPDSMGMCREFDNFPGHDDIFFNGASYNRTIWPLTQIKSPQGRIVKFEYGPVEASDNTMVKSNYEYMRDDKPFEIEHRTVREYIRQLVRITVDSMCIEFKYGPRNFQERCVQREDLPEPSTYEPRNPKTPRELATMSILKSITVKNIIDSSVIKQCDLLYNYTNYTNRIPMLTRVDISGEGTYGMNYYGVLDGDFPLQGTTGLDHWGFYNNNLVYKLKYLKPTVAIDANFTETVLPTSRRNPNFNGSILGMLSRINYPTGGYTKFYYEPHRYSRKLVKDYRNRMFPFLMNVENEEAGGVRIKKIATYASDNDSTTREFVYNYQNQDGTPGESSGILLKFPRYEIRYDGSMMDTSDARLVSSIYADLLDQSHIEYTEVMEKLSDSSNIRYTYSNYSEVPDLIYDTLDLKNPYNNKPYVPTLSRNWNPFYAELDSRYLERGKLTSKVVCDSDNNIVSEERYIYDRSKPLRFTTSVKFAYDYLYKHKTFVESYPLAEKISRVWAKGSHVEKREIYKYNALDQLVETRIPQSDGQVLSNQVQYPHDVVESGEYEPTKLDLQKAMMEHYNLLQFPVHKQTSLLDGNNRKRIISGRYYDYTVRPLTGTGSVWDTYMVLSAVDNIKIKSPLSIPDFAFETLPKERVTYMYDEKGNVIQTRNKDGQRTAYIWGYGGMYPVAKIVNVKIDDIIPLHTALSNLKMRPLDEGLPSGVEKVLRDLPDVLVTTYEYKRFVGPVRITDPSNMSVYYEYDKDGKLIITRDNDKKVNTSYQYHIQGL